MSIRPIVLSSHGLDRATSASEQCFVFTGKGWEFECTEFQACFISPYVYSLLQEDRSVNSLRVEFRTQAGDEKRIFGYLEQLMQGFEITPSLSDVPSLSEAASFLGNTELINKISEDASPLGRANV
jgi:hypothetical protein